MAAVSAPHVLASASHQTAQFPWLPAEPPAATADEPAAGYLFFLKTPTGVPTRVGIRVAHLHTLRTATSAPHATPSTPGGSIGEASTTLHCRPAIARRPPRAARNCAVEGCATRAVSISCLRTAAWARQTADPPPSRGRGTSRPPEWRKCSGRVAESVEMSRSNKSTNTVCIGLIRPTVRVAPARLTAESGGEGRLRRAYRWSQPRDRSSRRHTPLGRRQRGQGAQPGRQLRKPSQPPRRRGLPSRQTAGRTKRTARRSHLGGLRPRPWARPR